VASLIKFELACPMSPAPTNPMLFWTYYASGTFGPFLGILVMTRFRHPPLDDTSLLLSWLLWLVGVGLLIACVWSVRTILWGTRNTQHPAWLYRTFGRLALAEAVVWAWTCVRVI